MYFKYRLQGSGTRVIQRLTWEIGSFGWKATRKPPNVEKYILKSLIT